MSIRSRPRAGQLKDEVDEERTLWASIQADAKKIDSLVVMFSPPGISLTAFLEDNIPPLSFKIACWKHMSEFHSTKQYSVSNADPVGTNMVNNRHNPIPSQNESSNCKHSKMQQKVRTRPSTTQCK